ncbi:MAG: imidazole glycerol phosphate synthase subunit HisF [Bacteroidales bacterium]|nr:imidazole glycerol phosphate synthase subunit HisF [Bacteroidales bacterium]
MPAKRIIPCLDVKEGKTVKGIRFEDIRDVGDPVEMGRLYSQAGADELVYLDITASHEKRKTLPQLVRDIAANLNIPFTVGGGVSDLDDARILLEAGADKISVNSAAVRSPELIDKIARNFGSQFVTLAIDARKEQQGWQVFINGGRIETEKELFAWAREGQERGCGEILFTSMNHDGAKKGYAIDALDGLSRILSIPVIASGGAGETDHFAELFRRTDVDAALAASVFHYKEIDITEMKRYLSKQGIEVRI